MYECIAVIFSQQLKLILHRLENNIFNYKHKIIFIINAPMEYGENQLNAILHGS